MANFGIRFFLCNIFICIIIGFLIIVKRALKNYLTSRMQFNLWFLLLGILAVPFIPFRPASFTQIFTLQAQRRTGKLSYERFRRTLLVQPMCLVCTERNAE